MTKQAFLDQLSRLTGGLSDAERARLIEYYGEIIDDRVEEGVSEEDAVAALGDPAELAREFSPAQRREPAASASAETVSALNGLRVRVENADVAIVQEPLANGAAAQLRFSDPERFEWRMDGETLEIIERAAEGGQFNLQFSLSWLKHMVSGPGLRVTIALAGALPGGLEFTGKGGDLTLDGVEIGGASRLHTGSGDIKLTHARFAAALEVDSRSGDIRLDDLRTQELLYAKTVSGDMQLANLTGPDKLRLESASGDIALRQSEGDALTITTASGDIEVDRCRMSAASIRAASGDVRLDELEADPALTVDTASGDIDMTRCIARETRLKAASGDVELRLEPLPCGYDLAVNTVSGDIRLPQNNPAPQPGEAQPRITAQTVSGDVDVRIL